MNSWSLFVDDEVYDGECEEIAKNFPIINDMERWGYDRLREEVMRVIGNQGVTVTNNVADALWLRLHNPIIPECECVDTTYTDNESFGTF